MLKKGNRKTLRQDQILMFLAVFSSFEIYYISHLFGFFTYIYLGLQFFMIFLFSLFIIKKKMFNKFDFLIIIFCGIEFVSTYLNGISFLPLIKNTLSLFVLYLTAKYGLEKNASLYISTMTKVLVPLTVLNTIISVILYPNALYYSGVSPLFLIGGDNTSVRLYILAIMFSVLNNKKAINFTSIISVVSLLIFSFIRDLGTGKICLALMVAGMIFFYILKKNMPKKILKYCIIANVVFFLLIIIGNEMDIFSFIIVNLLNRELTLTTRTIIWAITIERIKQHPLIGYGYVSGEQFESLLPSIIGVNAHNTYLMVAYIGGITLIATLGIIFYVTQRKYDKVRHSKYMSIIPITLFTLMIRAQVEGADTVYLIFILFLLYSYAKIENNEKIKTKEELYD